MKTGLAILLAIILTVGIGFVSIKLNFHFVLLMVILTAVWAAWDSSKIELQKYKTPIAFGPIVIFVLHVLLWIVVFPWYLSVRHKIKNGLAELKRRA